MKPPTIPTFILAVATLLFAYLPQIAAAQPSPNRAIKVSVKGDRLAFASIADYKRAVDQPSEATKKQFARTVAALKGFTSFAQKQNFSPALETSRDKVASLIRDEYFASILNADLVVQIGDYIFRVNPSRERVYVLSAANEKEYNDLIAENARNSNIRTFSTNDDVVDVIEAGGKGPETLCSETGIGGRHSEAPVGSLTAMADFVRYGIYFTLFAMVSPYGSSGFPYMFEFTGGMSANAGYVYYHARCGTTASYEISTKGSWTLMNRKYQSYQGSKNLNEVYFFYRLKNDFFTTRAGQYATPYVGFRVNK
jgi:hypothetical protein